MIRYGDAFHTSPRPLTIILDQAGYNTLPWPQMGDSDSLVIQTFYPPSSTYASMTITPVLWSAKFDELQEQNKVSI